MHETCVICIFIYCFGFIGLAAFGLIPIRTWLIFRYTFIENRRNRIKLVMIPVFALSILVMLFEIEVIRVIHDCFFWFRCGPNRGNRWIHLAFIGCAYVVVEILFLVIRMLYGVRLKKFDGKSENEPCN